MSASLGRVLAASGALPVSLSIEHVTELSRGASGKAPLIVARRPSADAGNHALASPAPPG